MVGKNAHMILKSTCFIVCIGSFHSLPEFLCLFNIGWNEPQGFDSKLLITWEDLNHIPKSYIYLLPRKIMLLLNSTELIASEMRQLGKPKFLCQIIQSFLFIRRELFPCLGKLLIFILFYDLFLVFFDSRKLHFLSHQQSTCSVIRFGFDFLQLRRGNGFSATIADHNRPATLEGEVESYSFHTRIPLSHSFSSFTL